MYANQIVRLATAALAVVAALLGSSPSTALAHESVTVGEYVIEYGWAIEPVFAGQANALVINIGKTDEHASGEATPEAGGEEHAEAGGVEVGVSGLKVEVAFGGETKTLTLQPVGEDQPGQFLASLLPTRPGQYTLRFTGTLGEAAIDVEVEPEEVEATDFIQFPAAASESQSALGLTRSLAVAGLAAGLLGLAAGAAAFLRRK